MADGDGRRNRGFMGVWRAGRRPGLKAIMVSLLALGISLPMLYVSAIIMERSARAMSVRQQIAQDWGGGTQALAGPLLVVPFVQKIVKTERGPAGETEQVTQVRKHAVFTPEELTAEGELDLKRLKEGIYTLYGYEGEILLAGRFERPDAGSIVPAGAQVLWDQAYLSLAVSHPGGLQPSPELAWDRGAPQTLRPRARDNGISPTGIHAPVRVSPESAGEGDAGFPFRILLTLRGSENLSIAPLAARTDIGIASRPVAGEATGGIKPRSFERTASGSTGRWTVESVSLDWPRAWVAEDRRTSRQALQSSSVGVAFKVPTDYYGHVARVTRYAPLFVGLTFLAIFLLETLGRRQFHVVQYFMVGGSLAVFYLLLLALAEQMAFGKAYLIAASVNVLILSVYGARLAGSASVFAYFLPALTAIYVALYAFLEWKDQALLITSLVMLSGLAISMLLTPKVKWYGEE